MSAVRALKVPELREQLQARGLDTSGLKAALVERLEAAMGADEGHPLTAPANGTAEVVEAAADALDAGADPAVVAEAVAEAVAAEAEALPDAGEQPVVVEETTVVVEAEVPPAGEALALAEEAAPDAVVEAAAEATAEAPAEPPAEAPFEALPEPDGVAFPSGTDVPAAEDTPDVVPAADPAPEVPLVAEGAVPLNVAPDSTAPAVDIASAMAAAQAIANKYSQEHAGNQFPVSSGAEHAEEALGSNKRKFEEDEEANGQASKRPSNFEAAPTRVSQFSDAPGGFSDAPTGFSDAPGAQPAAAGGFQATGSADPAGSVPGQFTDMVEIPQQMVGKLIGKMGETIKQLQYSTGTKVQIDHMTPGDKKRVSVTGSSKEAVDAAKEQINAIVTNDAPAAGETFRSVDCPQGIVGRVIGRGGETIRALQQASQAHIVVEQNFPEGVPRKVVVTGRPDAVDRAAKMITELINGEPGNAQGIITKFGAGITRMLDCPKQMVGRVIGKGGETIKSLQRNFGANIQIDQSTDPMKITVSGQPPAVDAALAAVSEIVAGGNPYMGGPGGHDSGGAYGGPRGPPGGYGPPQFQQYPPAGGYGGYGGYPMQATPQPAYGGYGGYNPYAQPYAQPTAAAAYGGYGGGGDPYAAAYGAAAGTGGVSGGGGSMWQELHDNEGRPYYYNTQTGVSQWEKPADMA